MTLLTVDQVLSTLGQGKSLYNAELSHIELKWGHLDQAQLAGAYLRQANLSNTSLQGANLAQATLIRAVLSGADLRRAQLQRTLLILCTAGSRPAGSGTGGRMFGCMALS